MLVLRILGILVANSSCVWISFLLFSIGSDSFFLSLFIYFERDKDSMSRGQAEREGDRESQAGTALSAQSPMWGSNPWNHEFMTWAETKSQTLNQLSHRGAPNLFFFLRFIYFWERGHKLGRSRVRETKDPKQALCWQQWAWCRAQTQTVRLWLEPKLDAQPTEPSRCPSICVVF